MRARAAAAVAALLLVLLSGPFARAQEQRLLRMGTGNVTGVYYPVGVALCRLVNQHRSEHGIRCAAETTEGSVANIEALRQRDLELAIVQSDTQDAALNGTGGFDTAYPDLRAVMSLYPEPLTVVARADAGIAELADLAGKKVSLGQPGSGQRALVDALLGELGWTDATFAATPEVEPADLSSALCNGQIDAFVYAVGHPALAVQEATNACAARLIDVTGPAVDALLAANRFYAPATIPAGLYAGNDAEVQTFGVIATVVAGAGLPDDTVHTVVKSIFDDFDTLVGLNPALATLDPQAMATDGLSASLHSGAAQYYRERGWIE